VACAIDGLHFDDMQPRLAAESAGIHRQRSAQCAGDSCEKLRRTQTPFDALFSELGASHASAAAHFGVTEPLERIERAVSFDHSRA
jgi:hypothetical protein